MTGDGAVMVDFEQATRWTDIWAIGAQGPLGNLARAYLAKEAEIERLTRVVVDRDALWQRTFNGAMNRAEASEAPSADLLGEIETLRQSALNQIVLRDAADRRTADLLKALRECHTQLFHLFSMVEGEVPSLLEDHHSYPKIREALELGDAAIAAAKGGTV